MATDARQQFITNKSIRGLAICLGLALCAGGGSASAQQSWEYDPYDLRVWVSLEPSPRLSEALQAPIAKTIVRQGALTGKAAWKLTVSPAGRSVRSDIVRFMDRLTPEQMIDAKRKLQLIEQQRQMGIHLQKLRESQQSQQGDMAEIDELQKKLDELQQERVAEPAPAEAEQTSTEAKPEEKADLKTAMQQTLQLVQDVKKLAEKLDQLEVLDTAETEAGDQTITIADKLYVVGVRDLRHAFRVQVRELDIRMRVWGPVKQRMVRHPDQLALAAADLIREAFLPIIRIDRVEDKTVYGRLRSVGLIHGDSPCLITEGQVLQPVIRRNDRLGEPLKGGIIVAPWTFCTVQPPEGAGMTLKIRTGQRAPLGGRNSIRMKRYAILAKSYGDVTRLRLESDEAKPTALVGYDLYDKDPITNETEYLGKTDWRGVFDVPLSSSPFRVIYVRSGGRLLVRLPLMPGYKEELVSTVANDERRLEAEAFIKSVESDIMDQVVQRKLLTSYIRKRIKTGKLQEAEEMLGRFQALAKRTEMKEKLDSREGLIVETNTSTKRRIGRMFDKTEGLLNEHLDPATLLTLQTELQRAKQGGGAATPPAATPPAATPPAATPPAATPPAATPPAATPPAATPPAATPPAAAPAATGSGGG